MSSMLGIDSYTQGKASEKASKRAYKAAIYAANLQHQQYLQTRSDLMPWLDTGTWAIGELKEKVAAGPGEYEKSPYYNFLAEEGAKGLERGAAAKGGLLGGAEQKALTQYGQNLASTDYQTWLNNWYQSLTPYQSLAQVGQTTGTQLGGLGAQSAAQQGSYISQAGQLQAMGTMGKANALGGLGNVNNILSTINQVKSGINALSGLFGGTGITDVPVGNLTGAEMNAMTWL